MIRNKGYSGYHLLETRINTREEEREVGRNDFSAKTEQMLPINNISMLVFNIP